MSGIHDLKRALQLLRHFGVPPFVCVNIHDINRDNADKIVSFFRENSIEVVGKIPFNPAATEAMVNRRPVIEYAPESDIAKEIEAMWKRIFSASKSQSS